ncbi:MAG: L,D-transpeptidase family protein [Candidatus Margulisiibacteriota bacterium]
MKKRQRTNILTPLFSIAFLLAFSTIVFQLIAPPEPIKTIIKKSVGSFIPSEQYTQYTINTEPVIAARLTSTFYGNREFAPAWFDDNNKLSEEARKLILIINKADEEGLIADDYHTTIINTLAAKTDRSFRKPPNRLCADLDQLLTDAFFIYAAHLYYGKVDAETISNKWRDELIEIDFADHLNQVIAAGGVEKYISNLAPKHHGYRLLKQTLRLHRQRFKLTNDPSIKDKIKKIEVNMERFRWLPQYAGRKFILVDIAHFVLDMIDNNEVVLSSKVIVGKNYRSTPVFNNKITHIVFNPYWNIPHNIADWDILPVVIRNRDYLNMRHITVFQDINRTIPLDPQTINWNKFKPGSFPYFFRQDPGKDNVLGKIKFMFPNKYNVYLHDTPDKELFDEPTRNFSSGCIRVEKPRELAGYLLKDDPAWPAGKINAVLSGNKETQILLKEPVDIYLAYWTCWVDSAGFVTYVEDIYNRDDRVFAALKGKINNAQ